MSPTSKYCRRSIRLRGYDYTQAGAYFVTICAKEIDIVRRGDAGIAPTDEDDVGTEKRIVGYDYRFVQIRCDPAYK